MKFDKTKMELSGHNILSGAKIAFCKRIPTSEP